MSDDLPKNVLTYGSASFSIIINGNRNCLARVGSMMMYGSESHHMEVRLRIACEMILYRDLYLQENHLSKDLPTNQCLTPAMVAQFSDSYTGQNLDADGVKGIYLNEIQQVLKPCEYMGTWQLFALASVLKMPLFSAYPKRGNPVVRRHLRRVIMPRRELGDQNAKLPIVMWSSCRMDMTEEHWVPNHFTTVLPVSK